MPAEFVRALEGEDRFAAQKKIIAELERLEILEKAEPHANAVPYGDRSGVPIEPLLTTQWYCNAGVLAKPAIEAVETGKVKFVPQQWENTFFAWMRDIQPWCISRQLWWGHRIPAWYGPDGAVFVARDAEAAQVKADVHYGRREALTQDEDVLDTWFSSALWPFSTLGWPEKTPELAKYYPTDMLVTGFDIIFFWVARMMMMGLHFMGDVPFRTVYIHGLVRDERGQKMSKSKGNVIDPLSLIDAYGTDALRYSVAAAAGQGRDVKLGAKIVETNRSFVTKIWNAARFLEMNGCKPNPAFDPAGAKLPLSRWILDAANGAVAEASAALEAFRPNDYASACYRFAWGDVCDWFVEFAKPGFATEDAAELRDVAAYVLGSAPADAPAAAVRDRGIVGPFRLWPARVADPRLLAGSNPGVRGRGGAQRSRLGGEPDLRSPHRAFGNERAAFHQEPRAAEGRRAPKPGLGQCLERADFAHGPRQRDRPGGGRRAERLRASGAGRSNHRAALGRDHRSRSRARPAQKPPAPRPRRNWPKWCRSSRTRIS